MRLGAGGIVSDILEKNVSTNLDNIIIKNSTLGDFILMSWPE